MGIHDGVSKSGQMYMRDDTVVSQGPNEIISCSDKHLERQDVKKHIIAYADTCGGQS